jgi:hypothetical protein
VYHILVHNFYKRSTWLMRRKGWGVVDYLGGQGAI